MKKRYYKYNKKPNEAKRKGNMLIEPTAKRTGIERREKNTNTEFVCQLEVFALCQECSLVNSHAYQMLFVELVPPALMSD